MLEQFIIIASAHLFAVISPGPDFILVTRQSFLYGRNSAVTTSLGISLGILFHVLFCIFGFSIIIVSHQYLLDLLKILCSFYLLYLGMNSFFLKNQFQSKENNNILNNHLKISKWNSFRIGFLTNILNIKATFFFISIYSFIHNSNMNVSIEIQLFYGLWMSFVTGLWFVLVSLFLTNIFFNDFIKSWYSIINKLMGIILIYISLNLFFN
tara:strand:- start:595 stop:1224 length:630 start_codon:yes stop_codon:yes gene_type:complete